MLQRTPTALVEYGDADMADAEPASGVPFANVAASIVGLWLCYFFFITVRSVLIDSHNAAEMALLRLIVVAAGVAVTLLAWMILRQFDRRALSVKIAVAASVMLPAALVLAMINQAVFAPLDKKLLAQNLHPADVGIRHDTAGNILVDTPDPPGLTQAQIDKIQQKLSEESIWRQTTDIAISRYFLLLAWAALYLALLNAEQARHAERREGEYRRAAKAAELRSLRYQINPHFLFNTLNSLSSLVITGKPEAAERMIQTLSTFYRRGLAEDLTSDHTLDEEIELQRLYLEIEGVRFPDRLQIQVDVPDDLGHYLVPGMLLQPLVENAVKYGVARSRTPVTLTITARSESAGLVITVADDGPSGDKSEHGTGSKPGLGIGLTNVRDRLLARFGPAASITAGPVPGGYRTELRLPLGT
ncbi:MAG: histidine kinase [Novosphingobium sp.]